METCQVLSNTGIAEHASKLYPLFTCKYIIDTGIYVYMYIGIIILTWYMDQK